MKAKLTLFALSFVLALSLVVPAYAAQSQPINYDEYYEITNEIAEKYKMVIDFSPDERVLDIDPNEFKAWLDSLAAAEYASNLEALKNEKDVTASTNELASSSALTRAGSINLTKTISNWKIGVTAHYAWNSTLNKNVFTGGSNVYVAPAGAWQSYQGYYFNVTSSSCSVLDGGRTLKVVAKGTAYIDWVSFPNTTKSAEFYYTALPGY